MSKDKELLHSHESHLLLSKPIQPTDNSSLKTSLSLALGPFKSPYKPDNDAKQVQIQINNTTNLIENSGPSLKRSDIHIHDNNSTGDYYTETQDVGFLDTYNIEEVLGSGTSGTVFKAVNKETGTKFAIKELYLEHREKNDSKTIMNEIKFLKTLRHDHIICYHGCLVTEESLLILLELCEGGSLGKKCRKLHGLSEDLTKDVVRQVLTGFKYIHSKGIVHHDIKADNLLLTNDGTVKITDFGVSHHHSLKKISTHGSVNWMAPESILGTSVSTKSDIWSLGATIVELISGSPIYSFLDDIALLHAIATNSTIPLPSNISPECTDFLKKCFTRQISKRPSATELLLHNWLNSNQV
ncbi:hypothetical protein WICPIJ_005803 [Wickerhamomyces pijperi]|uniref:non-specific serine/threonine protein kinase n=1 Tax=Wickerhamomyces pijperi TaxID=599730 RepID=A0A9P8Q3D1_WICPI|nr:hypothetical protein WICPIJ_005803 [Wickerhamomyces pijperi]